MCVCVCVCVRVCVCACTLRVCDHTDCSPPSLSVNGIFQARILEGVAVSYSRDLSNPGIEPESLVSPTLAGGFFTTVPPGKPFKNYTFSLTKYSLYARFTKEHMYIQNKTELEQ